MIKLPSPLNGYTSATAQGVIYEIAAGSAPRVVWSARTAPTITFPKTCDCALATTAVRDRLVTNERLLRVNLASGKTETVDEGVDGQYWPLLLDDGNVVCSVHRVDHAKQGAGNRFSCAQIVSLARREIPSTFDAAVPSCSDDRRWCVWRPWVAGLTTRPPLVLADMGAARTRSLNLKGTPLRWLGDKVVIQDAPVADRETGRSVGDLVAVDALTLKTADMGRDVPDVPVLTSDAHVVFLERLGTSISKDGNGRVCAFSLATGVKECFHPTAHPKIEVAGKWLAYAVDVQKETERHQNGVYRVRMMP